MTDEYDPEENPLAGHILICPDSENAELHGLCHVNSPAGKRERKEGWQIVPVKLLKIKLE